MTYFAITGQGELVIKHGFPRKLDPAKWLTTTARKPVTKAWADEPDGAPPNIIGTVLLVTLGFERRPYRGEILLTNDGEGLPLVAGNAITSMHVAITMALMGVASGHGFDFDRQAISTAQMAEGPPDDRTG